jgi:hypothetical protein
MKGTSMAIIIKDFEPSGDTVEIQLPGSRKRYQVPTSDVLTLGDLQGIREGDFSLFFKHFPEESHEQLRSLHIPQLTELAEAWLGSPKD